MNMPDHPGHHPTEPGQHRPFQHTPGPRVPDDYAPEEYDPVTDAAPYNPVWHDPDYFNLEGGGKAASSPADRHQTDAQHARPHQSGPRANTAHIHPFDETPQEPEDDLSDLLDFAPVPGSRTDGWTKRKQQIFISNLATGVGVSYSARVAGMTPRSAYLLRARRGASGFIAAWEQAVQLGVAMLEDAAFDLALNGVPVHKTDGDGHIIHTDYRINASVLMQLLRAHKPLVYSYAAQKNAVRLAEEQRERAERAARYEASRPLEPTDDPQEVAVRECLAEEKIIEAAEAMGITPDLSDEAVAKVAASLPRIAPDQVAIIGMRLLEKHRRENGLPTPDEDGAQDQAGTDGDGRTDDDSRTALEDDNDDGEQEDATAPLNRFQRRAQMRKGKRAQNRKSKISYTGLKKRQKRA